MKRNQSCVVHLVAFVNHLVSDVMYRFSLRVFARVWVSKTFLQFDFICETYCI